MRTSPRPFYLSLCIRADQGLRWMAGLLPLRLWAVTVCSNVVFYTVKVVVRCSRWTSTNHRLVVKPICCINLLSLSLPPPPSSWLIDISWLLRAYLLKIGTNSFQSTPFPFSWSFLQRSHIAVEEPPNNFANLRIINAGVCPLSVSGAGLNPTDLQLMEVVTNKWSAITCSFLLTL